MSGARPWLSGSVLADGFWLPLDWYPVAQARLRVLAYWIPGSELQRTDAPAGYLLLWPQPRRIDCALLPGVVLQRLPGGGLSSGPRPQLPGLILGWGGVAQTPTCHAEDPASWLDLGTPELWQEQLPRLPVVAAPPETRAVRVLLPGLPPLSAEREQLQQVPDSPPGWWSQLHSWWSGLRAQPARGLAGGSKRTAETPTPMQELPAATRPGWWQFLGRAFGLARMFQWQHIAFLRRLLKALDTGDWDEALRHALPLEGQGGAVELSMLGLLRPREQMQFSSSGPGGAAIGLSGEFMAQMRQRYRQAFKALDAAGEIDKAAYVLAELLWETDEAIRYLGRHGRHQAAAELAQLRALPPARMIALWLKADDRERAVQLAQLHHAFADALQLLHEDRELSTLLRRLWATHLFASGEWQQAIEVLWPVLEDRAQVVTWMQQLRSEGGTVDARLLAREASLMPEAFERIAESVRFLLGDGSDGARGQVSWFAEALSQGPRTAQTRVLARETVRALWCDQRQPLDGSLLDRLYRHAEDPYLDADRPADTALWPAARALVSMAPLRLQIEARGSLSIRALSAVRDARCLLALGEAGSVLVDTRGRQLRRFPRAASAFVGASDSALRVGVQRRESHWLELAKLDLDSGRCRAWAQLQLHAFSPQLVHGLWAVAKDARVQLLDVSGAQPRCIWESGELPATVRQLAFADNGLSLLLGGGNVAWQLWRYRFPSLTLAHRSTIEAPIDAMSLVLDPRNICLYGLGVNSHYGTLCLQQTTIEGAGKDVWFDGQGAPDMVVADLQWTPSGLMLRQAAAVPDPARCLLLGENLKTLLECTAAPGLELQASADARHLWMEAGGALVCVDQQTTTVHRLVP